MAQYFVYSELNQLYGTPNGSTFLYDLADIEQSIYNLLTTPKGSRIFLAFYGTNIESILFELDDYATQDLLYQDIIAAINFWEGNRVQLNASASSVTFDIDNHIFIVNLVYNVKGLSATEYNYTLGISP